MRDTHHLSYRHLGNEPLEDLLGVCRPCHRYLSGLTDRDPRLVCRLCEPALSDVLSQPKGLAEGKVLEEAKGRGPYCPACAEQAEGVKAPFSTVAAIPSTGPSTGSGQALEEVPYVPDWSDAFHSENFS